MITVTEDTRTWQFPAWALLRTMCLFREMFSTWPWKETHMVDVGACVGSVSAAAEVLNCRVTALEPWPAAQTIFELNTAATLIRAAASNQKGQARMYGGPKWGMSHLGGGGPDETLVELVRLDDVVGRPVSLLKLDTEGHELQALQGARDILGRDRPRVIVELGGPAQRAGQPESVAGFLEHLGYVRRLQLTKMDWLFTHATDQVRLG